MKIVITGCAGFIGLNFTEYWLQNHSEDKIVGIDSFTYAANKEEVLKLQNESDSFTFYLADICDSNKISRIFEIEKPDAVVNFAAETHVDRSIENSDVFIKTNVVGTQVLLDACLNYGKIRFHQISTDEVYGDAPFDSDERFFEHSPLRPSSPYSASKAAADLLALSYFKTHSLPVTISRCSNNYGKYQNDEKMIPRSVGILLFGGRVPVYGDGKNMRDWIHVLDHCRAIDKILESGKVGCIYNVGSGTEISNLTLVKKISSLIRALLINEIEPEDDGNDVFQNGDNIGSDISADFANEITDNIEFVEDRKGHDRRYPIDSSKIQSELGWSPEISFEKGLYETVKWIKNFY